jgi:membrane protease YdiL (CAAX protease family)
MNRAPSIAALQAVAGWIAFELAMWIGAAAVPGSGRLPLNGMAYLGTFVLAVPLFTVALVPILRPSGEELRDLGLVRPSLGWPRTLLAALVCVPALYGIAWFMTLRLGELGLEDGGALFDLAPLSLAGFLIGAPLAGGFGEELLYRGLLQSRFERVLGTVAGPRMAMLVALCVTSTLFGLTHSYQGALGVAVTTFYGLAFGALHLATRRQLALPMLVHGGIDVVSFVALARG